MTDKKLIPLALLLISFNCNASLVEPRKLAEPFKYVVCGNGSVQENNYMFATNFKYKTNGIFEFNYQTENGHYKVIGSLSHCNIIEQIKE
jgi:hypothetical protein